MPQTTSTKQLYWIREFFRGSQSLGLLPAGDYTADTYVSVGAVVVSAALTGNRRPTCLAAFTKLPLDFVALVLILMDRSDFWRDDAHIRLVALLKRTTEIVLVEDRACAAVDSLWESIQAPYYGLLDEMRSGFILGGFRRYPE